jgi:HK97 family phage prohead protease
MEKFLKVIRVEVKDINTEKHTLTAVISTKKTDRDGDIVDPEAFKKRIKYYKDHPVLLSSHNYSDLRKQIGRSTNITIDENEVTSTFEYFVDKGNPEADWAWVLAQKGIAAYSIGFMGHQFDWLKEKDAEGNERITGRKFTDIELLEVSQVLVASNRGALQQGRALAQESAELCELAIKSFDKGELKNNVEQKPKPKPDESREDYMARCVPQLIGEGKDKDQAVAICSSMFENRDKSVHYSDELLGKEADPAISEPQSKELTIEDITGAVNEAVSETKKE